MGSPKGCICMLSSNSADSTAFHEGPCASAPERHLRPCLCAVRGCLAGTSASSRRSRVVNSIRWAVVGCITSMLVASPTLDAQTRRSVEAGLTLSTARFGSAMGVKAGPLVGATLSVRSRSRMFWQAEVEAANLRRAYAYEGWSKEIGVRLAGVRLGAVLLENSRATLSASAGPSYVLTSWQGGGPSDALGFGARMQLSFRPTTGTQMFWAAGADGLRVSIPWYGRAETSVVRTMLGLTFAFPTSR